MRIYLQTLPQQGATIRFCQILLQQDLLGGWSLVRESGHQGGSGRVRRQHFDDRGEAVDALIAARDLQLRRGYRVVFTEGVTAH